MQHLKPKTESGIKPDIVLPDGSRMRSLPWGGRQYCAMGIRRCTDGFEVVDLHPATLEPFPTSRAYKSRDLMHAAAWARYMTESLNATLFGVPHPEEPGEKPIEPPETTQSIHKRTNPRSHIIVS